MIEENTYVDKGDDAIEEEEQEEEEKECVRQAKNRMN